MVRSSWQHVVLPSHNWSREYNVWSKCLQRRFRRWVQSGLERCIACNISSDVPRVVSWYTLAHGIHCFSQRQTERSNHVRPRAEWGKTDYQISLVLCLGRGRERPILRVSASCQKE